MDELIDVLDKYGNKTGIVKSKLEVKKNGDYHRAISICFMNPNKEILLQQRSAKKRVYPNLWTMFLKGHIQSKEDSLTASLRETKEELGIELDKSDLIYLYTIKEEKKNGDYIEKIFFDTYLVLKDIDLNSINMNEEVSNVTYIDYESLKEIILNDDKRFVPNNLDYERIFLILEKMIDDKEIFLRKENRIIN